MPIIKDPTVTIDWGSGPVALTDHVIAARPNSPQEAADDRTFGNPYATDHTVGAESITLMLRWSDDLEALLDGVEDTEGDLILTPVSGGGTITATVVFSKMPMPEVSIGEKMTAELVLAITDNLAHA
jgi:hypothetical protein